MDVTIEQTGMITKQGKQLLIVIQQANWPKVEKLLGRTLKHKIKLETIEIKVPQ